MHFSSARNRISLILGIGVVKATTRSANGKQGLQLDVGDAQDRA